MLRLTLLVALTATPVLAQTSVPAPTRDTILTQEKLFWDHYTAGDTSALGSQLSPDFRNVEREIWSRDQVLKFVHLFIGTAHCGLAPVKIEDPQVTFLDPATATLVYHANETATCNGKSMGGQTNITSLWRFADGRWQLQLHTEYAIPADVKPSRF